MAALLGARELNKACTITLVMQLPHSPSSSKSGRHAGRKAGASGAGKRLQRGFQLVLVVLMALFALGLMLAAVVTGVVLTLGLVAWSLVRGRKPSLDAFQTVYRRARNTRAAGPWQRDAGGGAGAGAGTSAGEVVDIEVREIRDARGSSNPPDSADSNSKN